MAFLAHVWALGVGARALPIAESHTKQWTRDSGQGLALSVAVFFHSVDGVDMEGGEHVVPVKSEYCPGLGVGL